LDKVIIELNDLKIRAFHGFYKKEQEIGSFFIVNLIVEYLAPRDIEFKIENTINYEGLFDIVTQEMRIIRPLLENVCTTILEQIQKHTSSITYAHVSIEKLNPPIANFNGKSVKVSLKRNYEKH